MNPNPPPWSIHDTDLGFFLKDATGKSLGWFNLDDRQSETALRKQIESLLPAVNTPPSERLPLELQSHLGTLTSFDRRQLKTKIQNIIDQIQ